MPTDTTHEKQQIQELIERLAPSQVTAIRGLLEAMLDPVALAFASAQADDEPVTEEDRRRFRNGQAWFARQGSGIPMQEVLAEFRLKEEDVSPGK